MEKVPRLLPLRLLPPRLLPLRLLPLLLLLLSACSNAAPSGGKQKVRPAGTPAPSATAPSPAAPIDDPGTALVPPSGDVPVAGAPPRPGVPWFLTIGDSITSGYTRDPSRHGTNSGWPVQLQRRLAASGRRWSLYDTACPGETTETYRTLCPERDAIPPLAGTSQHDAAVSAISTGVPDLRLIVVALGSNDLLRSRGSRPDAVLAALSSRLDGIVRELRGLAPTVPLVLANYYDPFAVSIPDTLPALRPFNAAVARLAAANGAVVADFFDAINGPSAGDLCTLVDCADGDVHPTIAGHARLAQAVLPLLRGG